MEERVSRRAFVGGAALMAGAAMAGLAGCSSSKGQSAAAVPAGVPESWDKEADVVVVGCGAAGLGAAIAAAQGGASVEVLEAAPEGEQGGNTRVSGNMIMVPDTVELGVTYQTELNGPYVIGEALMQAWAEQLIEALDWLKDDVGIDMQQGKVASPEYTEVKGSEGIHTYIADGVQAEEHLWTVMFEAASEMGISFNYDARAVKLFFDPTTREVFGVRTEDGRTWKARKGVVLACGGFENNPDMLMNYFCGEGDAIPFFSGTPWNRGDGHKMVSELGIPLWHMNSYAGASGMFRVQSLDSGMSSWPNFKSKDYIYVNAEGRRFMYEERTSTGRHGRLKDEAGAWALMSFPSPSHIIFGQAMFDGDPLMTVESRSQWVARIDGYRAADTNQGMLDAGLFVKADTVEELAEKTGYDATTLAETIAKYNEDVAAGKDTQFGRGEAYYGTYVGSGRDTGETRTGEQVVVIEPFELLPIEPPYYAAQISMVLLNTQGGPKRNESAQTLDWDGNPIPRLYNCGEFGSIYAYMYNGGGNVGEAIATGRVAGLHAVGLDPWDAA